MLPVEGSLVSPGPGTNLRQFCDRIPGQGRWSPLSTDTGRMGICEFTAFRCLFIRGLDFMLSSVPISITSTFFVCFWWFFAQRVEMDAYEWSWKDFSLTSTWSPKSRWTVLGGWWSSSRSNSVARSIWQAAIQKMQKNPFFAEKNRKKSYFKHEKLP